MDLLFVVMAAVVAWVIGALWYRGFSGPWVRLSLVRADNRGDPRDTTALPYLVRGACLLVVASTMRALFLRGGIAGTGIGTGAAIGLALGTTVVTPMLVMSDLQPPRPLAVTLVDAGHAMLVFAVMGAILAALP